MKRTKDSNLIWIGAIPEDWSVLRGKNVVKKLKRPVKETDGVITCFRDGEVTLRSKRREEGYTFSDLEAGYQGIEPGDLVIHGMDGFAGAIGVSDSRGKGTPVLNVLDSKYDKRYLMYYFRTIAKCGYFESVATGIRVRTCDTNWNKISVTPCLVPTPPEQSRIASFLDVRCGKIDEAIAKHKALIEKLDEYRKAVITEAVTKGVSGKKNWASKAIKHSFRIVPGATPASGNPEYWDGDIIWITPSDYKTRDHYVSAGAKTITEDGYDSCSTRLVPAGSLIFSKRAPIGTVAISKTALCTNQGCLSCVPKKDTNVEFFYYAFIAYLEVFDVLGSGTTFKEISTSAFSNVKIETPSPEEQQEIVAYLDKKCAAIDSAKERHTQLIAKLEEYKKSLIYNAVTGKIEC